MPTDSDFRWHDFTSDYASDLAGFECASRYPEPIASLSDMHDGFPSWELEVQEQISMLPWILDTEREKCEICIRQLSIEEDEVIGVYWVRIMDGTWANGEGYYHLALYARSINMRGTDFGRFIIARALRIIRRNAAMTGRKRLITAYIDWRNMQSFKVLHDAGFVADISDPPLVEDNYRLFHLEF